VRLAKNENENLLQD